MTRVDDRLVSIDDSVDRYIYVYIKLDIIYIYYVIVMVLCCTLLYFVLYLRTVELYLRTVYCT